MELLAVILFCLISSIGFLLLLRSFLCIVTVSGISMEPTLQAGDRVVVLRRGFHKFITRQRIIIMTPGGIPPASESQATATLFSGRAYIKRITALGGEKQIVPCHASPRERWRTLAIRAHLMAGYKIDPQHIPGESNFQELRPYTMPEHRNYALPVNAPQRTEDNKYVWEVPDGYCFVMGDNREIVTDSREWGPIPIKSILGVVILRLSRREG